MMLPFDVVASVAMAFSKTCRLPRDLALLFGSLWRAVAPKREGARSAVGPAGGALCTPVGVRQRRAVPGSRDIGGAARCWPAGAAVGRAQGREQESREKKSGGGRRGGAGVATFEAGAVCSGSEREGGGAGYGWVCSAGEGAGRRRLVGGGRPVRERRRGSTRGAGVRWPSDPAGGAGRWAGAP